MRERAAVLASVLMSAVGVLQGCGAGSPTGSDGGNVAALLAPVTGAVLDNGCATQPDAIVWDFDWSDVPGADAYHLYVIGPRAVYPVVDHSALFESAYTDASMGYIIEENRRGWRWRVRARVGNSWGPWSSERTFDVEALDSDCRQ